MKNEIKNRIKSTFKSFSLSVRTFAERAVEALLLKAADPLFSKTKYFNLLKEKLAENIEDF